MAILLTGLTGVVGSELAKVLQAQTQEKVFCLVRNGKERVENGELYGISANQILNGDIAEWFCELSTIDLDFLKRQNITKVVHGAASVKFDDELLTHIWTTNFIGTKNVLSLAKILGAKEFHYISTAYAPSKRNHYEISKFGAEELIRDSGITHSIYRLGIVVGDSQTGSIKAFNGFYGFFVGLHRLAERERKKRVLNGAVDLPIYLNCSFASTLNLVPIDWAVRTITELIKQGTHNETFHITHPNPPRVQWVMEQGLQAINVKGVRYNDYRNPQPIQTQRKLKIIQKAVNNELKRYGPYITEEDVFSLEITCKSLGEKYKDPCQLSSEFLAMLLNFAVKKNFGKIKRDSVKNFKTVIPSLAVNFSYSRG